jgi:hypothetical protein
MKELFVTCSRAGKFQWEQDGAVAGAKYHEKPVDALEHHPFEQEVTEDIPGPNVTTDPSAVSYTLQSRIRELTLQPYIDVCP